MSSTKRNTPRLLRVAELWALTFFLLPDAHADIPWRDEHENTQEQVLSLKQFEPQLANLRTEYRMALKSPEGASQFQATIRKAIANIDAASKPITAHGNNLPASFSDLFRPQNGGLDASKVDCYHVGVMGLSLSNYVDQVTLDWAAKLIISAPDILMPVLLERAKISPPTVADYILFGQITENIIGQLDDEDHDRHTGQVTAGNQVFLSSTAGLLTLAKGKNPIYRLLVADMGVALCLDRKSSHITELNAETTMLNLNSQFLNETDPIILSRVISGMAEFKTPAAVSLLQSFRPAVQKTEDANLEAHLQDQIQRLKQ